MKAAFITFAALPLLVLAAPASAEPAAVKRWLNETAQEIGAHVQNPPAAGTVVVRASVGGGRRFNSVEIAGASGSPALDRAVLEAARRHRADVPPTDLIGSTVLLRVTPAPTALAEVSAAGAR